jgi:hypothetical protein
MAESAPKPSGVAHRGTRHRAKLSRSATRRLEVTVPVQDAEAIRRLAATALQHDLTLVTRNSADLAGLGVRLLNPWGD